MAIRLYSVDAIFCKVRALKVTLGLAEGSVIINYLWRREGGLGRVRGFRLCHFKIYLISPPSIQLFNIFMNHPNWHLINIQLFYCYPPSLPPPLALTTMKNDWSLN